MDLVDNSWHPTENGECSSLLMLKFRSKNVTTRHPTYGSRLIWAHFQLLDTLEMQLSCWFDLNLWAQHCITKGAEWASFFAPRPSIGKSVENEISTSSYSRSYFFHLSHQSPIKSAYVLETKLSLEVRHGKTPIFTFNEYSKLSFLCHLRFGVKFSEETLQFFWRFCSLNCPQRS